MDQSAGKSKPRQPMPKADCRGQGDCRNPPNMVVKIPMTAEGLKATKVLSGEGIKVNVTLIFSANQALLAARAGAAYVSPFLGRLDDISQPGIDLIQTIVDIFSNYDIQTEIICASVRNQSILQTVHSQVRTLRPYRTRLLNR